MADGANGHDGRRKKKRRGKDHVVTRELMLKVVYAVYFENGVPAHRPMRKVAKELGITAQMVSACLDKAHKDGICKVVVDVPHEEAQVQMLSERLRRTFGLKQVILVPGNTAMLRPLERDDRRRVHGNVIRKMMPLVAGLLDDIVKTAARAKRDCHVTVAWGRSMRMFADELEQSRRATRWSGLRVLPAVGPTEWLKTDPVEASINAMRVASAYGGSWGQLPCPAFVPAADLLQWLARAEVDKALTKLRESDCVITSLGPIPETGKLVDVTLSNDQAMSDTLAADARRAGAIGEINYWAFDADGKPVKTDYCAIGLGFDGLQTLSADKERSVILICGGDRHRIAALKGALAAKLCNVLVSDTVTARALLGEEQQEAA